MTNQSTTPNLTARVLARLVVTGMLLAFVGCTGTGATDLVPGSDSDQTGDTNGDATPDTPEGDDPDLAGGGPVSIAGEDQTVPAGAVVTLNGSSLRSLSRGSLSFMWVQLSGPPVQLDTPNAATTTFTAPEGAATATELIFELRVSENGMLASDSVRVIVISEAPGPVPINPCPGGCSDGVFCNGAETCIDGQCTTGTAPSCNDGLACTIDSCDSAADACRHVANHARCDNGRFCDGAETCNAATGCVAGADPCPGQRCDEATDTCTDADCSVDADCTDGLFCNGVESCTNNTCVTGTPIVCDDGIACTTDSCDEAANICTFIPDDPSCEGGPHTPANFRIAVIGDLGVSANAAATLNLVLSEGAEMVLHLGDLGYGDESDPQSALDWEALVNTILGPNYPYFSLVGNHDREQWGVYQQLISDRLARIPGAVCTGTAGELSSCRYQGLFMVMTAGGIFDATTWDPYINFTREQLAQDTSTWRICAWHKNKHELQLGSRTEPFDVRLYEECRLGRAMILTAHEHSYHRTKTLTDTDTITIDPAWPDPDALRVSAGATFVVVNGLGGASLRNQDRCVAGDPTPFVYPYCDDAPGCIGTACCTSSCFEWASVYSSDSPAEEGGPSVHGAMFIDFHVNGNPNAARGYFKNINGDVVDTFTIVSETP